MFPNKKLIILKKKIINLKKKLMKFKIFKPSKENLDKNK